MCLVLALTGLSGCASSGGHGGPPSGTLTLGGGSSLESGPQARSGGLGPSSAGGREGVRLATGDDLAAALLATLTQPVLVALDGAAASIAVATEAAGALARALPDTIAGLVCHLDGPKLEAERAELVLEPATDTVPAVAALHLEARSWTEQAPPVAKAEPAPVGPRRDAVDDRPIRLELRATEGLEVARLSLEAGGWLVCALPSLRLRLDGRPIAEQPGWPADVRAELTIRDDGLRLTAELPADAMARLVLSSRLELEWDGGRATLVPIRAPAAAAFGRWIGEHARQAASPEPAPDAGP